MENELLTDSELMLNEDGSIYHLNLLPGEIADTIILVGDPHRATVVSHYFDRIELCKTKREFITYTGYIGHKRMTVVGTGIGAGNIDIVMNELDAVMNIDFKTRRMKSSPQALKFFRLGTTGATHADIPVDSLIVSDYACGFDGLLHYYNYSYNSHEIELMQKIKKLFTELPTINNSYACQGSTNLCRLFHNDFHHGITLTCIGFYGPQHRRLRAPIISYQFHDHIKKLQCHSLSMTNFEMETAIIYGLSQLLGHSSCSISAVLANRETQEISQNPELAIKKMIEKTLPIIIS